MQRTGRIAAGCLVGLSLLAGAGRAAGAQSPPPAPAREKPVTIHARGTFDVQLTPQAITDSATKETLGRMSIVKQYHGDLDGTGSGEMLTAMSAVKGSGAYVAVERVTGTLAGRHGSFLLQHMGTMARGAQSLSITVVPDSGTDGLAGITGTLSITITDGKHFYDFEYAPAGAK
jgi:hypothetical protein